MMPTASSVVGDIIDVAVGRGQRTFAVTNLWSDTPRGFTLVPAEKVRSRFYLRMLIFDRAGTLADVCRVLADHGISITSIIQKEALEGVKEQTVPLVIMTHYAETAGVRAAIAGIGKLACVTGRAVYYSVDD